MYLGHSADRRQKLPFHHHELIPTPGKISLNPKQPALTTQERPLQLKRNIKPKNSQSLSCTYEQETYQQSGENQLL